MQQITESVSFFAGLNLKNEVSLLPPITLTALILFALTYIVMMVFQKIRPHAAIGSAVLFVLLGVVADVKPDLFGPGFFDDFQYSPWEALGEIDWNVILMIAGTMGTVYLFIRSKMPKRMSEVLITKVPNVKWAVLAMSLFAGIISAFVDNVATVLMIAPVALALCKKLKISPVAPIICIAVSSNLQGAATLVGDTTSILLAKAANLDFFDFFVDHGHVGMFWVVEAGALASAVILFFMFRKQNDKISMTGHTEVKALFPAYMLLGTVVTLILTSFIPYKSNATGSFYKPEITNGLICMLFFLVCLVHALIKTRDKGLIKEVLKEIDFYTIALLVGLFIVIGGVKNAGVIELIGDAIAKIGTTSKGSVFLVYTVIVWASVLLSAFIDNIPYTATMLSVVAVIAAKLSIEPKLLYYGLLCGATLGGNLTPIGASANIAGIGILRKEGYEVKAGAFMKYGVPFTLVAVTVGYLLIWFIW